MNRHERRARLSRARRETDQWQWQDRPEATAWFPHAHWGPCIRCCASPLYAVMVFKRLCEWGLVEHIAIRRHDKSAHIPFGHKQRIKNEFAGPGRVAVEVYPPEAELVDSANMFHLWVLPEAMRLPFSLKEHGAADDRRIG